MLAYARPRSHGHFVPGRLDKTAEGQAENRRVVVRILQNKGISGT
jgi:flagellar motor protein MotB